MSNFLGTPKVQFFDDSGNPLSGGKLYTYATGTTTAKASYPTLADAEAGTNANANPVILDSRGEANVVLSGSYKLKLDTGADANLWTVDAVGTTSNTLLNDVYGNSVIVLASGGASSVNQLTATASLTGVTPSLTATGTDTNVGLKVASKGSGALLLDGGTTGVVDIGTTSSGVIGLKRNTAVTGTLSTSGAATLASAVITAGATVGTTLGVSGAATLDSAVITNGATVGTTLGVTGAATLGSAVITNGATVGTTLGVTGAATLGSAVITNGATVGTTLGVTGNATLKGLLYPTADGTNKQVIQTNGSGTLSFASQNPGTANYFFSAAPTAGNNITSSLATVAMTEQTDTQSVFASNVYTPTVAGYYHLSATVRATSVTTGEQLTVYLVIGINTIVAESPKTNGAGPVTVNISGTYYLSGAQTAYVQAKVTTTTTTTVANGDFSGFLVQIV